MHHCECIIHVLPERVSATILHNAFHKDKTIESIFCNKMKGRLVCYSDRFEEKFLAQYTKALEIPDESQRNAREIGLGYFG